MKRITIIAAAFVVMLALGAGASVNQPAELDVRAFTMGGPKMNNILKNQSNIWLYPQAINMYPDVAEGVFQFNNPNSEFRRLGVHYQFGSDNPFVLGVYVDNVGTFNPYSSPAWAGTAPFTSGGGSLFDNNQFNVFYGRDLNGNPFGAHLTVFTSSNEDETVFKQSLTSVGLDLGLTANAGTLDLSVGFLFTTFTDELANVDQTEPDGNLNLYGNVRRWWAVNSTITWVGHAQASYNKLAYKTPQVGAAPGSTEEFTDFLFDIGLGLNYTPTSKVHALLDFGFEFGSGNHEFDGNADGVIDFTLGELDIDNSQFSIPPYYALGFDAEVLSWLDLRMGASNFRQGLELDNQNPVVTKVTTNFNSIDTYLGVGMHFGNLTLDANVDPSFVVDGPDFVSGTGTNNLFMYVAGTYNFGN